MTARALGLVGLFTLLVAVAEDVPSSWSAVYARQEVEVPAGVAGLAYVAFAAAMTVGRFGNDWLVERFGEVAVTRAGAASAAAGVGLAAVSGTMPVVLLGFTVAGLGVSSLFPALFHAAGTRPGIPTAQGVAFVAWVSRVGFLFAPLIVGIVADAAGLSRGLLVGVLAATLAAALAGVLRPPRRPPLIPHDARHDASETLAGNPARGVGPPR